MSIRPWPHVVVERAGVNDDLYVELYSGRCSQEEGGRIVQSWFQKRATFLPPRSLFSDPMYIYSTR